MMRVKEFSLDFLATPETIDELGHVNNAVWVQWLQKIATSHWDAAAPAAHKAAYIWVVVRHEIDYLRSLAPSQRVTGRTWVAEKPSGAKFDRFTEFKGDDGRVHLRAKTSWALLDKKTGRPLRVTDDILAPFTGGGDGWRAMGPLDLAVVDAIAQKVHVNFPEPAEVFSNRLQLYPRGCMVYEKQGQILGYMIAHPWPQDAVPPKLGAVMDELPDARSLYLHDIALLPEARGSGAGGAATERLFALARAHEFRHIWLTAVDGADSYWSEKAFRRVAHDAPYGEGTLVMEYILEA
jgi:acyl-CoA thioester hydrolase